MNAKKITMDARDAIKIGMSAERTLVVPVERTVGHFVPGMPMVYATPMMILEMEMASDDAIRSLLQPGGSRSGPRSISAISAPRRLAQPFGPPQKWLRWSAA
jgi:hypothetical protein